MRMDNKQIDKAPDVFLNEHHDPTREHLHRDVSESWLVMSISGD